MTALILMCGVYSLVDPSYRGIFGIDDKETLPIYKEKYLDSYSRRRECVMAWMINTILQGDPNLPNADCFR